MGDSLEERKQALLASVDEVERKTWESKIHLIRIERSEVTHGKASPLIGASGNGPSAGAIHDWWKTAVVEAKAAADKLVMACFDVGVTDDEVIARYVSAETEQFLRASAASMSATLGRGYLGAARVRNTARLQVQAAAVAGQISHRVRSLRHDFLMRQKRDNVLSQSSGITVHGSVIHSAIQSGSGAQTVITTTTASTPMPATKDAAINQLHEEVIAIQEQLINVYKLQLDARERNELSASLYQIITRIESRLADAYSQQALKKATQEALQELETEQSLKRGLLAKVAQHDVSSNLYASALWDGLKLFLAAAL